MPPGQAGFLGPRVQPPSWFVGLPTRRVEVILYDEGIGLEQLTLEGDGASLVGVQHPPNDNYLIAEVVVDADARPGALAFVASGGRRYDWPLERPGVPTALSPADLVYLIMPDRFANGDPDNDSVPGTAQTGVAREKVFFRHGGDLAGIEQQLDYLADLGATALWLNPVLANDQPYESYHGYAVTDHYAIDPRLGSVEDYGQLVERAHAAGLKVLMDLVPNHVGDRHYLYADAPASDWFHLPDSFTLSNFRIPSALDPHAAPADRSAMLDGWFDKHMPDLDQSNPHVRRYLTQVALWWLGHSGHDGYRVDTYPYSDPEFMANWSAEILTNFPTAAFFGEVWVDGLPNQAAFVPGIDGPVPPGGNTSATDFQLYDALHAALLDEQSWAGGVAKLWLTLTQDWVYDNPNQLITFLDNHDLARLATRMNGDTTKIKSALTLLLTTRGTPMIYYGTEVAIDGEGGAFGEGGRRDMPGGWAGDDRSAFTGEGLSEEETAVQRFVRHLATYRRDHPGMALGTLTHFVPEDGVYVYFRTSDAGERWMVAYNSRGVSIDLPLDRFSGVIGATHSGRHVTGEGDAVELGEPLRLASKEAVLIELGAER